MHVEAHNPSDRELCIVVDNVSFDYGAEPILVNVSFVVHRGDYIGVIGPNGGGKTTLLKLMLGLLRPTTGSVKVFGEDVYRLKGERAHIGYVPQRASQIDTNFPATVEEIVASGRTAQVGLFRRFTKTDRLAIDQAIAITDIGRYRSSPISRLSGGERQRVFIARALAGEPEVIILDEPSVGVDVPSQEQFYDFLATLNHQHGLTIVLVSHDIDIVTSEVHSLLCINRKVVCQGPAKDLLKEKDIEELYGRKTHFTFHGH